MGAAIGHYGDLFVMRKHDPAHHQGDLSGIRRTTCRSEAVHYRSGREGESTGPPGTLQYQADGHY